MFSKLKKINARDNASNIKIQKKSKKHIFTDFYFINKPHENHPHRRW